MFRCTIEDEMYSRIKARPNKKRIVAKRKKQEGVKLAGLLGEKERQYLVGLKKELQKQ